MAKATGLKKASLQNQNEALISEIKKPKKNKKKSYVGLITLKGILKGKGNFSEDDFAMVKMTFKENP